MIDSVKKSFIKKFFLKYYIFGYLCILGFIPQSVLLYSTTLLPKPYNVIPLIPLIIGSMLLLIKLVRITLLTRKKYRYYKTAVKNLEIGKYDKSYFLRGMYDPCFRVIVKDLLMEYNRNSDYNNLLKEIKIQKIPVELSEF